MDEGPISVLRSGVVQLDQFLEILLFDGFYTTTSFVLGIHSVSEFTAACVLLSKE